MRKRVRDFKPVILVVASMIVAGCAGRSEEPKVAQTARRQPSTTQPTVTADRVRRISTAVPFPRGLQMIDGQLYVLARGRVRESGGVDGKIDDKAGSIYTVDPDVSEPISDPKVSQAVQSNGKLFAAPTSPPFKLFDRTLKPATRDRETDRPYCSLRYDPTTQNFYLCAFSGIDKPEQNGSNFSKNVNDAVLRYDTRNGRWFEVERHSLEAGGNYPHHDPYTRNPPHGWLNGPDNCLVVGKWLYCVAKDNSLLARYDLSEIRANPEAGAPRSEWVMDSSVPMSDGSVQQHLGHSMLAVKDGFLYIGFRTTSTIVRVPIDDGGSIKSPIKAELVARFDPYNPDTRKSANLTDMGFGPEGDLYVISAQPSRVYRFTPDAASVFDGRSSGSGAWANLWELTGNPKMKSENIFVDEKGRVFVTSGDAYTFQNGAGGAIYCIEPEDLDTQIK